MQRQTVIDPGPTTEGNLFAVWRQDWEWAQYGNSLRPSGYTLHLTEEDGRLFIVSHWSTLPIQMVREYQRPAGRGYLFHVTQSTYIALMRGDIATLIPTGSPGQVTAALN